MLTFIIRRLLYAPVLLFGVALLTFVIFNVVGGSPVYTLAGKNATPQQIHELSVQYGFDRPLFADVDFALRRIYRGEIRRSARTLANAVVRQSQVRPLVAEVQRLYGIYDEEGDGAALRSALRHLRRSCVALQIDVPAPRSATMAELQGLSGAISAALAQAGTERQKHAQVLREHMRLAVPELVQLATATGVRELEEMASYELDSLVFENFTVQRGDSDEEARAKLEAIREWWASAQGDYTYAFDLGRTFTSLFSSQFARYLGDVFTFNFGQSYKKKKDVIDIIAEGAPRSLMITVPAFLFGTFIAVAIGLLSTFFQGRVLDRLVVLLSVLGMSVSILVFIITAQLVLAHWFGWFPVHGYEPIPEWDGLVVGWLGGVQVTLGFLVLPWIIWVLSSLGADVRFLRTAMVDERRRDYIRTARAKGLTNSGVMLKHLLKNAMIPIITYVVIALPYLYTGSLLLERYFGIPGLGKEMVEAILASDFPVIKALTIIGSVFFIFADVLTNVLYAVVDPRVRL